MNLSVIVGEERQGRASNVLACIRMLIDNYHN